MNLSKQLFLATLMIFTLTGAAWSAELFVDQSNPKADDKNAGTEALPFKTIQPAANAAQPGDTIWVKAGIYDEGLVIDKSGKIDRPITLSAWKDDRVRLGSNVRPLPTEGKWVPIPGSKSWQVKLTGQMPEDLMVILDGKGILTFNEDGPPKDDKPKWATYRKADRTLMFNAAGKDPAALGTFEYGRKLAAGIVRPCNLDRADYWIIRKLEFSYCTEGLRLSGANSCVIEDCFFTRCYSRAVFNMGNRSTFRRCNFYRCGAAIDGGGGDCSTYEDNLVVECFLLPEEDMYCAVIPGYLSEGGGPFVFKGYMQGLLFSYNILSDNQGGWWADCPGSQYARIIGNAFWDNPGGGIYNEDKVHDTMTQGNVFYRNGIGSSVSTRWSIVENLFVEGGIFWNNLDINPLRDGYMLLRKNAFINPPGNGYLIGYASGWGQYAWPEVFSNCIVDRNRIWAAKDAALINDGGAKKCKTLEEIRKEYGWELHGDVQPYDKDKTTVESVVKEMGGSVVTFRIPWGKHSGDARPMLANSQITARWPAAVLSTDPGSIPCFFWRVGDGYYEPVSSWGKFVPRLCWQISGGGPNAKPEQLLNGCRWYLDADAKYPADLEEKTACRKGHLQEYDTKMAYTEGNTWMVVEGVEPARMMPQGMGYWTPMLAAAPGAKITVSLKMRGKDLVSSDKGSPAVWMQFTNETGQHRQRVFIVGKDDAGKVQHEELTKGNFDWTDVKETITAPQGAIRMALFVGMTPCKGQANFDDIDITTASEAATVAADILLPRLPLQRFKETVLIDISKQANRRLTDETDNDGKGGWTDQGPGADMRELKTGDRRLGGVMFRLLPDAANAVIVLKSLNRPKGELPDKVTIPVGKKLDTLFFLHSAAWCPTGNEEAFHYVVHYADGKDVTLKVTGNNLVDWIHDGVARFPLEEETFTTAVETVKNTQFKQGSLYRMEWSAPLDRRGVEIKSIDFVGGGNAVPILLGITGIVIWN